MVLDLTTGLKGNTVTTDNFFTSLALATELMRKRKIALVGTLRRNRKEIPHQLLQVRMRTSLSSLFCFTREATAVSYMAKPKKNVLLLSTKLRDAEVSEEPHKKPRIILDYN